MVSSRINEKVTYPEIKTIDENDKGRDVSMFKIVIHNIPVVIALGDVKYTFVKQKIMYAPVYLIVDESDKIYQIGVYEFKSTEYENLLDKDNDLDISLISGPLLYSFVDKPYIKKCMKDEVLVADIDSGDETSKEDSELEDISDLDNNSDEEEDMTDIEEETKSEMKNPSPLLVELDIEDEQKFIDDDDFLRKGEDEKQDKKEKKKYVEPEKKDSQWIEQFMHNNNYNIIDNDGSGDCLFYTVRDAYKSIGINASVDFLRSKLADVADQDVLDNYKDFYNGYEEEFKKLKKNNPILKRKIQSLKKNYNQKAKSAKAEKDRPKQKKLIREAKNLKQQYKAKSEDLTNLKKELAQVMQYRDTWKWMKNIKNLDDLKAKIKTCDFWADIWAISTLEMVLNTKIIILSSENYDLGKYEQVLRCGDFVPKQVEDRGYFKPKYYIIVEHTGNHYKLITYKDIHMFRFYQIPYGIKELIKNVCMKNKRGKTLYHYIPKFAKLIGNTIIIPTEVSKKTRDSLEEVSETKIEMKDIGKMDDNIDIEETVEMTPTPTPDDHELYDDEIHFMFYSKSADKKPGKGNGEKIPKDKMLEFNELAKIKQWRKTLSNFYTKPERDGEVQPLFELDGLKWASVEHYYHANKFKKSNPDYYRLFSIDSGSQIMGDPRKALGAGGKTGKISGKKFRPKNVVIDRDFYDDGNDEKIMEKAQEAKYRQDEHSRNVLLLTKEAKLLHYVASRKPKDQRPPPVVFYDTMRIRNRLKKEKN